MFFSPWHYYQVKEKNIAKNISLLPVCISCLATRMECTSLLPVCTSCLAARMQCLRPFIFKVLGFGRDDHFLFGLVFIKKVTKLKFIFLKKTKTGSNRPVLVRFGFLGQNPVQTGLARFFQFWLDFLGFGSIFSVLAWFFRLSLILAQLFSVRFGFFSFFLIKPKPNQTDRFFQNFNQFNQFFFSVQFFWFFFLVFSV